MQRLTVRKKETAEVAGAEMSFALSQRARHAARVLLQRFPDTGSDPGARREASRPSGRLNDGIAQVPPPRGRSELEAFRQTLPVAAFREQLLGTIAKSNILLVLGETGSGKTTQIPQYILDEGSRLGSPCRVICAQPRRISAVAAAERVAEERGEGVGQTVGYQIRLESKVSPKTLLTFCTNDVLLRTLMAGDSATSTVVTHIIVDEIHERDRFCDILLIKLRDILERQCNLRVVLMSAPLNVSLFSEYFGGCPVVRLPGRLFEVKRFFLEDILPTTGYKSKEMERRQKEKDQRTYSRQKPPPPTTHPPPALLERASHCVEAAISNCIGIRRILIAVGTSWLHHQPTRGLLLLCPSVVHPKMGEVGLGGEGRESNQPMSTGLFRRSSSSS
ncbi:3'-5' RNA helicase YTHDC2-like [Petromyzon marinus]|uniref:3'-5' RNA helicase YTHDC2-like n=1 Tax=Petromyzon marinus TaxID=7757 RepID=UPI003F6E914C